MISWRIMAAACRRVFSENTSLDVTKFAAGWLEDATGWLEDEAFERLWAPPKRRCTGKFRELYAGVEAGNCESGKRAKELAAYLDEHWGISGLSPDGAYTVGRALLCLDEAGGLERHQARVDSLQAWCFYAVLDAAQKHIKYMKSYTDEDSARAFEEMICSLTRKQAWEYLLRYVAPYLPWMFSMQRYGGHPKGSWGESRNNIFPWPMSRPSSPAWPAWDAALGDATDIAWQIFSEAVEAGFYELAEAEAQKYVALFGRALIGEMELNPCLGICWQGSGPSKELAIYWLWLQGLTPGDTYYPEKISFDVPRQVIDGIRAAINWQD